MGSIAGSFAVFLLHVNVKFSFASVVIYSSRLYFIYIQHTGSSKGLGVGVPTVFKAIEHSVLKIVVVLPYWLKCLNIRTGPQVSQNVCSTAS